MSSVSRNGEHVNIPASVTPTENKQPQTMNRGSISRGKASTPKVSDLILRFESKISSLASQKISSGAGIKSERPPIRPDHKDNPEQRKTVEKVVDHTTSFFETSKTVTAIDPEVQEMIQLLDTLEKKEETKEEEKSTPETFTEEKETPVKREDVDAILKVVEEDVQAEEEKYKMMRLTTHEKKFQSYDEFLTKLKDPELSQMQLVLHKGEIKVEEKSRISKIFGQFFSRGTNNEANAVMKILSDVELEIRQKGREYYADKSLKKLSMDYIQSPYVQKLMERSPKLALFIALLDHHATTIETELKNLENNDFKTYLEFKNRFDELTDGLEREGFNSQGAEKFIKELHQASQQTVFFNNESTRTQLQFLKIQNPQLYSKFFAKFNNLTKKENYNEKDAQNFIDTLNKEYSRYQFIKNDLVGAQLKFIQSQDPESFKKLESRKNEIIKANPYNIDEEKNLKIDIEKAVDKIAGIKRISEFEEEEKININLDFSKIQFDVKVTSALNEIFKEIAVTENTYKTNLEALSIYYTELKEKKLITQNEYDEIEKILSGIIKESKKMIENLKKLDESKTQGDKLKFFLETTSRDNMKEYFKLHFEYITQYAKFLEKINKISKAKESQEALKELIQKTKLQLVQDVLITPVQRLPRHKMLIESISKQLGEQPQPENADVAAAKAALLANYTYLAAYMELINASTSKIS